MEQNKIKHDKENPIDLSKEMKDRNLDQKKEKMLQFMKKDKDEDTAKKERELEAEAKEAKSEQEKLLIELTRKTMSTQKDVEEKMASVLMTKEELRDAEGQRGKMDKKLKN